MRREQRVDVLGCGLREHAGHRRGKSIPLARAPWLDVLIALRIGAKRAAQRRDRLFETVVADGGVAPACGDQVVLRHHAARVRGQVKQHAHVAVAQRDRLTVAPQLPGAAIELEDPEGVNNAAG